MQSPKTRAVKSKIGISDFLFISLDPDILPEIKNPHRKREFFTTSEKDTLRKVKFCYRCINYLPSNRNFFHMWIKREPLQELSEKI